MVIINDSAQGSRFNITYGGESAALELPAGAVATFRWEARKRFFFSKKNRFLA
jgi:O-glycosyl hydrolase